ncbi:MAG TPA: hypothetical protein VF143_05635, partial [Candidatus Nanopelagicales bacterium]
MQAKPRRSTRFFTAGAVLAALLVPAGVLATDTPEAPGGLTPAAFGQSVDAYLAIETGTPDRVELYDPTGLSRGVQTISSTASGCALVTDPLDEGTGAFLRFSGRVGTSTTAESWASGSIGVAEKKSGTSCYQVNSPGETLRLSLGTATRPAGSTATAYAVRSAYLDVELKQDARILATALLGGNPVGYFELQSGSTIGQPKLTSADIIASLPYSVQSCNNPSDSGPDSGVNDNCRWATGELSPDPLDDVLYDTLALRAVNGSFSLEYGRDGRVTSGPQIANPFLPAGASYFELTTVDGILNCNGVSVTRDDATGLVPEVTFRRLPNASGPDCAPVPYTLTNQPRGAQFLKPLDQQTTAQFVADFTWILPVGSTTSLPPTS